MAQPDRSGPKSKTLYEIADERMAALKGTANSPLNPIFADGKIRDESGNILDDEPLGPISNAIFLTLSLSMVHFTLDVLVYQQYRQEIEWGPIFRRTGSILLPLFVVIWLLCSRTAMKVPLLRQVLFLGIAVAAGCYTIFVGNNYTYYAVMKQAPPLGTLWIWSVYEMELKWALVSVVVDVGYLLWKGYTVF